MQRNEAARHYPGRDLEAMSFALNYHRWIVDQFAPYLAGSVAEVGAGNGSVSKLLLGSRLKRLHAFEPSDNMYRELAMAVKRDPRATAVNDFFRDQDGQKFDTVVYINVLEHIESDEAELATAYAAMKPGGHLILFVPALDWLYSDHDREIGHFRRYTKRGLASLVEEAGFTVVTAKYFDVAGIIPWYLNFVLLRNSIGAKSVAIYDNVVVPLMRRVESAIPPPIGKNVLLIGRKN